MDKLYQCIPTKIEKNILLKHDKGENTYLISKVHPEFKKLELNKVSKDILNFTNGSNNINIIVGLISEKYIDVEVSTIESDVLDILFQFWRLGIVGWINSNPYEDSMTYEENGIMAKILAEEQVVEKLNNMNNVILNPFYSSAFQLKDSNIRKKVYNGVEQFVEINNGEMKIIFSLLYKRLKSKSCFLNFYVIDSENCLNNEFKEVLDWSIKNYQKFVNYKFHRVDVVITNKYTTDEIEKITSVINQLNFKNSGCLKDSVNVKDKYFDINLFSLNL